MIGIYVYVFRELEKSKHMYLLPLTGILISSLENVSLLFYQASNCIFKLLPTSVSNDDLMTIFETGSFSIRGEVTYQTLKVKIQLQIIFLINLEIEIK